MNDYNVLIRCKMKENQRALIMASAYKNAIASPHDDQSNFNDIYIDFN